MDVDVHTLEIRGIINAWLMLTARVESSSPPYRWWI